MSEPVEVGERVVQGEISEPPAVRQAICGGSELSKKTCWGLLLTFWPSVNIAVKAMRLEKVRFYIHSLYCPFLLQGH